LEFNDVRDIRVLNLKWLAAQYDDRKSLADAIGYKDVNYLNQMLCESCPIGNTTSVKINIALDKPSGWMDTPHINLWSEIDDSIDAVSVFDSLIEDLNGKQLQALMQKLIVKLGESSN